jgi:hypothetical protein
MPYPKDDVKKYFKGFNLLSKQDPPKNAPIKELEE